MTLPRGNSAPPSAASPPPGPDAAWLHPHVLVRASAGTGKTYTLSTRYLHILLSGRAAAPRPPADPPAAPIADPSSVLATTFTRKAAGEILDRVLRRLLEAARSPQKLDDLARDLRIALTPDACTSAAAALARRMDRVRIMTIDAMMQRLARAASLDLGVAPGWSIATEADVAQLHADAIDAALSHGDPGQTAALMRGSTRNPLSRRVHHALDQAVADAYATFLTAGADPALWDAVGPTTPALSDAELSAASHALALAPLPTKKNGLDPDSRFVRARDKVITLVGKADWEALISDSLGSKILSGGTYYNIELPPALTAALRPIVDHAAHRILARLRERNRAIAALLARYDTTRADARRRSGLLEFDDIPRLLVEAEVANRLTELWYRLDAAIEHLLIDEAQDTSLIQFRLIEPILAELLSGRPERGALIVGDVKQSLYAWRQAEAQLLPAIADLWPILRQYTLARSQRSSQTVLDAVNSVFRPLTRNPVFAPEAPNREGARDAAAVFAAMFEPHQADPREGGPDGPGLVRLQTHPLIDPDAQRPQPDIVAGAVEAVLQLMDEARAAQPGNSHALPEIGVLLRRNAPIRPIVSALRARGLDASEEGGAPLADDPAVAAVLSLLQLADHPSDALARFHVAMSPIGAALGWEGVPSPARTHARASRIRRSLALHGYGAVLEALIERASPHIPPASIHRLDQMLDLAREFDARASLRPTEFIDLVCERRIARPGGGQVRVMTIHGAKGLEFDAVVLPDLERKWSPDGKGSMTLRDTALAPVQAASMSVSRAVASLHPLLGSMSRQREHREVFEELCSLYVGMTRAKRALVMLIAPYKEPGKDAPPLRASGVLRGALAADHPQAGERALIHEHTRDGRPWWDRPASTAPQGPPLPAEIDLTLAPPRATSLRRARVVSPSSLEGGDRVDLSARLTPSAGAGTEVGTIAHAILERIDWLDADPPHLDTLHALGRSVPGASPDDIATAASIVHRALHGNAGACLRRDWHDHHPALAAPHAPDPIATDLRREWRFLHDDQADGQSRLISGVIDRLVLLRRRDTVIAADIIDYKTDRIAPGDPAALTERTAHYRPQLRAYAASIARMFALPHAAVRATLLFLSADKAVEV